MSELPGRALGVDLGLRRTGLALSDELRLTTRRLEELTPRSRREDVEYLRALVEEHAIVDVVIGHPRLPRSGDEGAMAKRAAGFAAVLQEVLGTRARVHLIDEAGSSKEASERLVQEGVKKSQRKSALDQEAARVILERWLSERPPAGPSPTGP